MMHTVVTEEPDTFVRAIYPRSAIAVGSDLLTFDVPAIVVPAGKPHVRLRLCIMGVMGKRACRDLTGLMCCEHTRRDTLTLVTGVEKRRGHTMIALRDPAEVNRPRAVRVLRLVRLL